ncbi:MAG TPA: hypothetical protein VL172_14585 [Kofleriaceae bacterium]|nr:hypothetical protein [Kofleriaceae bacterium]
MALLLLGRAATAQPQPDVEADDAAWARLVAREPSAEQVRRWALAACRLQGDPEDGWAHRARWSAALPRLSLRARRGTLVDRDRSSASSWVDSSLDVDLWLEARAEWDLSRLLFDERELRAAEAARRRRQLALEVARRVTAIYFQRRRLQVTAVYAPPDDPAAAARLRVRIDELGAQLDALTGGRFGSAGRR